MRTFNKKGDQGETSLLYGGRVPKSSPRPQAYGAVDEAMSALGLARALATKPRVKEMVLQLQKELSTLCAELATDGDHYDQLKEHNWIITEEMVNRLEEWINELEAKTEMPKEFILPGATVASGALDLARSMIRRGERQTVVLWRRKMIHNEHILSYLNRAADLVFTLARYEESAR